MGILDSVLGGLLGGQQASSPIQSILGSILGGGQGGAMGGQSGGMAGSMTGGLGGLVQQFEHAGLGNIAQSWVSNGPNQAVQPQQLQQVFGQNQINQWSQQSGMAPDTLLGHLAQFLPHAVDTMTPGGQMPQDGGDFDGAGVNMGGGMVGGRQV